MGEFAAFSFVIILMLAAYWSLVIFPKQRDFKKHNQMVTTLGPGDEVITFGGIIGTVVSVDAESGVALIRIAEGVEVKCITASLTRPYVPDEVRINARIGIEPGIENQLPKRSSR
jgi:preprotein translocase subunit YajC